MMMLIKAKEHLKKQAARFGIAYTKLQEEQYLQRINQLVQSYNYPLHIAIEQAFNEEIVWWKT